MEEAAGLLADLVKEQDGGDENYFNSQLRRYLYSIRRINQLCPTPCRVLDIGSHYLHQSTLLSLLGYDVYGLDVPLFTKAPFIQERSRLMNIQNISSGSHQLGDFLGGQDNSFNLVVCTEMLEHITFNPVVFWRRVWELLSTGGILYVTTPNVFRIRALVKNLIRFATFEGVGIPIDEILTVITYGHHWKEYSSREIRKYFKRLSPDFSVEIQTYPDADSDKNLLSKALEIVPAFRTNIEVIIRLRDKTTFLVPPALPMESKSLGHD
ncbi:class I SAM-dependent methyltransferase [Methyloglobulus morosus]|uniref:class I SAM-dependent methyltransferase n=1 Tax=Methyloglobulus morosus TaxID=1410681 RepID=UPI001379AB16|nr:methyltransferase domain-containing protein [Methyloglobulus morosus]